MARKGINIFLDSNVILSGFISEKGAPRLILDLLCHEFPFVSAATGQYNIEEIDRAINRKLPSLRAIFHDYMARLKLEIVPLPSKAALDDYRGVIEDADLPVLVSAIQCGATYLVTGDKKHFGGLKGRKDIPVKVCTPSEVVDMVAESIRKMGWGRSA